MPMVLKAWKVSPRGARPRLQPVDLPPGLDSLDGADPYLPAGVYTTFRTYNKDKTLRLGDHFRRLETSAALAGQPLNLDEPRLRQALRQSLASAGVGGDLRFRLVLDLQVRPGDFYIVVEELPLIPQEIYLNGARAVTCRLERQLPRAKLTAFIAQASRLRQALSPGINEALMVDAQGFILEGLSSNFFAVKSGEIWTASQGVLDGITRSLVLEGAAREEIPLHLEPVRMEELPFLQEAFITSASRMVLPLAQIDATRIGNGVPGPVTLRLVAAYASRLELELEPI